MCARLEKKSRPSSQINIQHLSSIVGALHCVCVSVCFRGVGCEHESWGKSDEAGCDGGGMRNKGWSERQRRRTIRAYVTASHSWPGLKKKKKVLQWPSLNTRTHTRILAWCIVRADLCAWFLLLLSFCASPFLNSRFCVFFRELWVCVLLYGPRD